MVYSLVFGVGENMAHQLSNDSLERISTPKEILRLRGEIIQHVACGDKFTILTTTKDHCEFPQLYVIGDNDYGQLSLGHFHNATSWTNVTIGIKVKQLICGDYHTIALSQDGEVFSCGRSDKYQLGLTNQSPHPLAEFKKLKLNEKIKLIACGTNHSIFVTENNEIFGCGDNSYFQLGSKKKDVFKKPEKLKLDFVKGKGIKGVSCGYQHTIYLTEEGNIFCFGNNTFGQLNINLVGLNKAGEGQTISKIECGSYHTICCTDKGQVWGCGKNRNGELGIDNDGSNVDVVTKIKLENNVKIENVVVGNHHSVMVASDNRLFSCGKNTGGQLGLGHLEKVYKVNELKLPFPVKVLAAGGYHSVFCCEVSNDMAEDIETQV
ncbi:hypothetical protein ABK040_011907 [Willaertia magna]